jgi:hypothetical protein
MAYRPHDAAALSPATTILLRATLQQPLAFRAKP